MLSLRVFAHTLCDVVFFLNDRITIKAKSLACLWLQQKASILDSIIWSCCIEFSVRRGESRTNFEFTGRTDIMMMTTPPSSTIIKSET